MIIPIPQYEEPEIPPLRLHSLDIPPNWRCKECNCLNHGLNSSCPYCRERLRKATEYLPAIDSTLASE